MRKFSEDIIANWSSDISSVMDGSIAEEGSVLKSLFKLSSLANLPSSTDYDDALKRADDLAGFTMTGFYSKLTSANAMDRFGHFLSVDETFDLYRWGGSALFDNIECDEWYGDENLNSASMQPDHIDVLLESDWRLGEKMDMADLLISLEFTYGKFERLVKDATVGDYAEALVVDRALTYNTVELNSDFAAHSADSFRKVARDSYMGWWLATNRYLRNHPVDPINAIDILNDYLNLSKELTFSEAYGYMSVGIGDANDIRKAVAHDIDPDIYISMTRGR